MIRKTEICSLRTGTGLLLVALVIGFLAPTGALAAAFGVNGQVFRVDPGDAAEPAIPDADLVLRDTLPYVKVRVLNAATRAVLGEGFAGENGNFAVTWEAPPGTEVEVQALTVLEGDADPLAPAREGINTFTPAGAATAMAVRVIAGTEVDLAPLDTAGVGFVFTEVGKVEIPYICQAECTVPASCPTKICNADQIGLADMSGAAGLARASTLKLPSAGSQGDYNGVFRNAPFGGTLFIFGAFAPPKNTVGCTDTTDWYRVKYRQLPAGGWTYWTQKLEKQRYELTWDLSGALHADSYLELVGPINGSEPNLYRVDPLPAVPLTAVVVNSFANLRMLWRTGGLANGLYEIELEFFNQSGGTDTNPVVTPIPGGCTDPGVLSADDQNQVAVNKLRLHINNQPPTTALDGIYIRSDNGPPNQYLASVRPNCSAVAPTRTTSKLSGPPPLALDFNAPANRCHIMELDETGFNDVVEIDFKARHDGGFLRSYSLRAASNAAPPDVVPFASDHYGNHAGSVAWYGLCASPPGDVAACVTPRVSRINTVDFPQACAYNFDLVVRSRNQNGYGYLHRPHIHRAYYVRP